MKGLRRAVVIAAQILVGSLFVFSGFVKAIDPMGSAFKIGEYLTFFGISLPLNFHIIASVALCCTEFMVGAMILVGSYRRLSARLVCLMMCFMTALTLYIAIFNPVKDCGCFGDAFHISNWATFAKNVIFLLASILLAIRPLDMLRVFSRVGRWIPSAMALGGIICFAIMNVVYLPIIDFRPFKVGAHLPRLVRVAEEAPKDEFELRFTYQKDGHKQSFDMDHLPDSTWTFVSREEKLIRSGEKAPVQDFHIFSYDGEELTDSILYISQYGLAANDRGLILLLTPDWQQTDDSRMDVIGEIYDRAASRGIAFYAVSGSTESETESWRYRTGADYPILLMDATTIKTIVRARPGLLFVRRGQITAKVSDADLPAMDQVDAFIDKQLGEGQMLSKRSYPWLRTLPLMVWLLLILTGYAVQIYRHINTARKRLKTQASTVDRVNAGKGSKSLNQE